MKNEFILFHNENFYVIKKGASINDVLKKVGYWKYEFYKYLC